MSRHNRRRTRVGNKPSSIPALQSSFGLSSITNESALPKADTILIRQDISRNRGHQSITARHWHNRYIAWQARDRRQREEMEKLQVERSRMFGEATNDAEGDDGLCLKMEEYFSTLDFVN